MRTTDAMRRALGVMVIGATMASSGCKTLSERYIALEVWKYERCFGHLPPGFVPPGAAQAPQPMRTCAPEAPCAAAPAQAGCEPCHGGVADGGLPAGARIVPDLPPGPGGAPTPLPTPAGGVPAPVSAGRPVVISDEVVLP